jgi:hypothetical protein
MTTRQQLANLEKRAARLPASEPTVIHVVYVKDWQRDPGGESIPAYDIILEPDGAVRRENVAGGYYDQHSTED